MQSSANNRDYAFAGELAPESAEPRQGAGPGKHKGLSPKEFGEVTGLSMATVRRLLAKNKIPKYQPGGKDTRFQSPWLRSRVVSQFARIRNTLPPRTTTPKTNYRITRRKRSTFQGPGRNGCADAHEQYLCHNLVKMN
jgi:excisionase family DNA binding protein